MVRMAYRIHIGMFPQQLVEPAAFNTLSMELFDDVNQRMHGLVITVLIPSGSSLALSRCIDIIFPDLDKADIDLDKADVVVVKVALF